MKKLLDFKKLVLRVWLILWAILLILLIMKFCFGKWYPIVVKNNFVINICNFIDNHKPIECFIGSVCYIMSNFLCFMSAIKRIKLSKWWYYIVLLLLLLSLFLIKYFFDLVIINFLEIIILVVFPIVFNIKVKNLRSIVVDILLPVLVYLSGLIFQSNILLIRDINTILTTMPSVIYLTMQIDYYIFLIIMWLGVNNMGWLSFGWLFGKSLTDLEEIREKELAKKQPDLKLLEEVDKAIAEKEKEV